MGLNLWTKILAALFMVITALPTPVLAEPVISGLSLPPASFTHVQNLDLLEQLGLSPSAWCYDDNANAILITAASRCRARCELKLQYELETQKAKNEFETDKLELRISTLVTQHREINEIRDKEIERLTAAALKRPNDYSIWWASGGLVAGALVTAAIFFSVQ